MKFLISQGAGSLLEKPAFWNSPLSELGYFEGVEEEKGMAVKISPALDYDPTV